MAPPAGGVLTAAVAARRRPVEDAFDPASDPARRLWLGRPYRLDRLHDQPNVNSSHRQVADGRMDVGGECGIPLCAVLGVAPAGLMGGDITIGTVTEGHSLSRLKALPIVLRAPRQQGVIAVESYAALRIGAFARLGERDIRVRAKPEVVALFRAYAISENPGLRPRRPDPQIEPFAIGIQDRKSTRLKLQ